MDKQPSPTSKIEKTQLEKDAEWLENWQIKHTPGYTKMADRREFSQEDINSFVSLINTFKINHSIKKLLSIVELDEENQEIRNKAKNDLNIILALLKKMQNETKINQSQFEEFNNEYKIISQAIGILNNGKIDHTR